MSHKDDEHFRIYSRYSAYMYAMLIADEFTRMSLLHALFYRVVGHSRYL